MRNSGGGSRLSMANYNAIHIVFGDSVTGSLRHALPAREKVIGLPALFSTGPISDLHEDNGMTTRYEWFENHSLFDGEDVRNEKLRLKEACSVVTSIPEGVPVYIWAGDNAHEQTGMRLALYLLKDQANDVHVIHATRAAETLLNTADWTYELLHAGEIAPDLLKVIYAENKELHLLCRENRRQFEKEWLSLATTREVLRVWENKKIVGVSEDFYDAFIVKTAQRLHEECGQKDFIKSTLVIGNVMGHAAQYISDQFIEYRVRHLIKNGIFEYQGVLKAMRFYSVKLR